jgi:hypothetical protein
MIISFSSCEKEGIYNPKRKISKIYVEAKTIEKYLVEEWSWDDNKLVKIEFPNRVNPEDDSYQLFEYDGNLISTVTNSDGTKIIFTYSGKELTNVKYTFGDEILEDYEIIHSKNKISKIIITRNYDYLRNYDIKFSPLYFLFPRHIADVMQNKRMEDSSLKSISEFSKVTTITLTWDGNNPQKITEESMEYFGQYFLYLEFNYDKNYSPFSGFFLDEFYGLSKNNCTYIKSTNSANENVFETYNEYTFTSGSKFPIECYQHYSMNNSIYIRTFYEYLD